MELLRETENEKENISKIFFQRSGKILLSLRKLLTGNVIKFKILRTVVSILHNMRGSKHTLSDSHYHYI